MCAHTPLRDTPEYKKFCSHGRSTQGVAFHYELLDKDVPRGQVPLTAAFGWTGEMNFEGLQAGGYSRQKWMGD